MLGPVFEIILPIFGLLVVGYIATSLGLFDKSAVHGLTRYVFDFAVPMLLLRTLANTNLPDVIPWAYLASYYSGTLIVLLSGIWLSGLFWKRTFSQQVVNGFTCSFSNTVLLGIPIILLAFGEKAVVPLFIIIGTNGLIMVPLFTILLEIGKNDKLRLISTIFRTMYGVLSNPLIIGLISGILCNYFKIQMWKPLDDVAKLLGDSVTPCALFVLGATLAGSRKGIPWKEVPLIIIMKIVVHPLIVWSMAIMVFGIKETIWIQVLVILAAQPTGVNPFLFASRYNVGQLVASSTFFISTIFSIFTLSLVLALFR